MWCPRTLHIFDMLKESVTLQTLESSMGSMRIVWRAPVASSIAPTFPVAILRNGESVPQVWELLNATWDGNLEDSWWRKTQFLRAFWMFPVLTPLPPFFTLFVSSLPWQLTAGSIFFVSRYGDGLPVPSGNTPRPQPRWWSYKWRHEGLFFTNTVSFFLAWPEREHVSGALVLLPFSFNLSSALVNGMFLVLEMFLVYLCTALHTIRKAVGFILNAMFCCHYGGGSLFYCHRTTSVVK